jgi:hypothetical protein
MEWPIKIIEIESGPLSKFAGPGQIFSGGKGAPDDIITKVWHPTGPELAACGAVL